MGKAAVSSYDDTQRELHEEKPDDKTAQAIPTTTGQGSKGWQTKKHSRTICSV